jgi:hypothetical protein
MMVELKETKGKPDSYSEIQRHDVQHGGKKYANYLYEIILACRQDDRIAKNAENITNEPQRILSLEELKKCHCTYL